MGLNAFTSMVSLLDPTPRTTISKQDYEVFQKEYIFDMLKGKNFGRAFCERFKFNDPIISEIFDSALAKELIEDIYVDETEVH